MVHIDCATKSSDKSAWMTYLLSLSPSQMLKQGKQQIQHNIAWPKQQLATNKPSSVSSPSKRDEEEDEDDVGTAVPDFKESWLQGCSVLKLANDDARGGGEETNKGESVLLFVSIIIIIIITIYYFFFINVFFIFTAVYNIGENHMKKYNDRRLYIVAPVT